MSPFWEIRERMIRLASGTIEAGGQSSVAPVNTDLVEMLEEGQLAAQATSEGCRCTCTQGPITALCDGTSK